MAERTKVFDLVKTEEASFISSLHELLECLINPMSVKDTQFKRQFLSEPAVAVSFSLLAEIHKACSNFYYALVTMKSDQDIASAYANFAPSLQLFAQYTSENAKLLNAIDRNKRNVNQCLSKEIDYLPVLIRPLEHYQKYRSYFEQFVHNSENSKHLAGLTDALAAVTKQSEYIDIKLQEELESQMLLMLQSKFSGNPVIFTPNRKLLKEGEIDKLRVNKKGEMERKQYYAHLFNDSIAFSTKRTMGGYKLHSTFDFKNSLFSRHEKSGATFGFTLEPKDDPEKAEDFCMANEQEATEWFQIINDQIEMLKTKRIAKRSSALVGAGITAATTIPGVQLAKLGKRCGCIYKFLIDEMQFADAINALNVTLVQPLINASKGAVLSAAMNVTEGGGDTQYMDRNEALFDNRAASTTKYQTQLVTEALQEADVIIFLRAAEGLAIAVREFVKSLEQLCTKAAWDESVIIGPNFNSVSAISLYNQFKSYSAGQQAMVRVLRTPAFAQFHKDAESFLSNIPGSLQEKLELPRKRLSIYLHFMTLLSSVTPESHPDHYSVKSSLLAVEGTEKEIVELIKNKKNFESLLEIQSSLVTLRTEPVVQKLASMERTFITQGDLKKVCRKKNKMFRFWLFNDYLLYGESLGGEKFSFHRALELSKCTVAAHTTSELRNAIEIFGSEKSFIVIALTEAMFTNWLEALTIACAKAKEGSGSGGAAAAPLWTPDHNSANCPLCNKAFTLWNRRHHCRKCGGLMCSDHLNSKELIPHIHATQKQKICDNCAAGKTVMVAPVQSALPPPVSTPTSSGAVSPKKEAPQASKVVTPVQQPVVEAAKATPPPKVPPKQTAPPSSSAPSVRTAAPPVPSSTPPTDTAAAPMQAPPPVPTIPAPVDMPQTAPPPVPKFPPPAATTASEPAVATVAAPDTANQPKSNNFSLLKARYANKATAAASETPTESKKPDESKPALGKRGGNVASKFLAATTAPVAATTKPTVAAVEVAPKPQPTDSNNDPQPIHVQNPVNAMKPPPRVRTAPPPPPSSESETSTAPIAPVAAAKPAPQPVPVVAAQQPPPAAIVPPTQAAVVTPAPVARSPPPPPASSGRPAPPPPPPKSSSVASSSTPVHPPQQQLPSPPQPVAEAPVAEQDSGVDDPLRKYKKMKEMLPAGAVKQKMLVDGFSMENIDKFLAGMEISAPEDSPQVSIEQPITLKAASDRPVENKPSRKMSLLDEIQLGAKLKVVAQEPASQKPAPAPAAGGILGMLAQEMSKRRFNMNVDEGSSDSDSSGFSDSDSDSD